jgi:hypothetical protein
MATAAVAAPQGPGNASGGEDLGKLISASDLVYDKPVPRSEEGMPIGNGRMGTLVWTTPTSLRMQINRVDVYANDSTTNSFFERHNDYCGGCGYVDIDFGREVFPETGFKQRLNVYDGLLSVGNASLLAWPDQDVIAVLVNAPVQVNLRMLRFDNVVSEKAESERRTLEGLGIEPTALEVVLPTYFSRFRERGQLTQVSAAS